MLIGPPLLGMLADHVGYRQALLAIAIPVLISFAVVKAAALLPGPVGRQVEAGPAARA